MIMVNKWDLIEKDSNTAKKYEEEILERLGTGVNSVADQYDLIIKIVGFYRRAAQRIDSWRRRYAESQRKKR